MLFFSLCVQCQVLPFGSQVTGLSLPGSDLDFVIRFTTNEGGTKGKSEKSSGVEEEDDDDFTSTSNPLRRFADAVRDEFGIRSGKEGKDETTNDGIDDDEEEDGEHLSYLEVIEQTRVPLVKFTVAPYGIDIDVCFDQPNGPESAELMHRFMESMPPLRPLTFVLKHFLASREINKPFTGGIGSYLLQLMIVSYLQHRTREDVVRKCGAGGRHFNLGSLLLDFFELYGINFNYVTTAISVRHDGFYFAKGEKDRKNVFWQPSRQFAVAMENPLDPGADVGAGAFRMSYIQRIFSHAFKTLLAYVSEPLEPTDSILARIIPPTEEMERRMELKRDAGVVDETAAVRNGPASGGGQNNGPASGGNKATRRKMAKKEKKMHKKERRQMQQGSGSSDGSGRRQSGGGSSGGDWRQATNNSFQGGKNKGKNAKRQRDGPGKEAEGSRSNSPNKRRKG